MLQKETFSIGWFVKKLSAATYILGSRLTFMMASPESGISSISLMLTVEHFKGQSIICIDNLNNTVVKVYLTGYCYWNTNSELLFQIKRAAVGITMKHLIWASKQKGGKIFLDMIEKELNSISLFFCMLDGTCLWPYLPHHLLLAVKFNHCFPQ